VAIKEGVFYAQKGIELIEDKKHLINFRRNSVEGLAYPL